MHLERLAFIINNALIKMPHSKNFWLQIRVSLKTQPRLPGVETKNQAQHFHNASVHPSYRSATKWN